MELRFVQKRHDKIEVPQKIVIGMITGTKYIDFTRLHSQWQSKVLCNILWEKNKRFYFNPFHIPTFSFPSTRTLPSHDLANYPSRHIADVEKLHINSDE